MFKAKIFCLLCLIFQNLSYGNGCKTWFDNLNLKQDNCVLNCQISDVGMGYFQCPQECEKLCNQVSRYSGLSNLLTSKLCDAEKKLLKRHPTQLYTTYGAYRKALEQTQKLFGNNQADDESDAFRHCFWSSLLTKNMGKRDAKKWLNAHESCSVNTESSSMDYTNNSIGIKIALKLKKMSDDILSQKCEEALNEGKLKVLFPRKKQ